MEAYGIGGSEDQSDLINQLQVQVANLQNQLNVGNVLGGMVRTQIAPAAFPIGPYRQDVDASFGLEFTLWIPDYALRLKRALIVLTPKKTRIAVGSSTTAPGTGLIEVPSVDHAHAWAKYVTTTDPGYSVKEYTSWLPTVPSTTSGQVAMESFGTVDLYTDKATPAQESVANSTHTHPITLAISESGLAAGMHLYIDGVDRTSDLGGPWSTDPVTLDITTYLVDMRLNPVVGAHAIKVTSTAAGAIEAVGDIYGIIKAIQS